MAIVGNLSLLITVNMNDYNKKMASLRAKLAKTGHDVSRTTSLMSKMANGMTAATPKLLAAFSFVAGAITKVMTKVLALYKLIAVKLISGFKSLAKTAALALGVIYGAATYVGAGFERSMSKVLAFTGATADQLGALSGRAQELGRSTIFSAKQAASGMAILARAGMSVADIYDAMPALLNMAAVGEIEVAEAAEYAAKIMAQMHIPANQFRVVVDSMAVASATAVTDMEELSEAMSHVGGIAYQLGVPINETIALLQLLANAGIAGERGGTTLRNIFNRLAGGASVKAQRKLKALGIEVESSTGSMRPMADIVNQFTNSFSRLSKIGKVEELMSIFELRAGPGMLATMSAGAAAVDEMRKKLENVEGAAKDLSDTMWNNVTGSFKIMMSALAGIGIEIFTRISPVMKRAIDGVTSWLNENNVAIVDFGTRIAIAVTKAVKVLGVMFTSITSGGREAWAKFAEFATDSFIIIASKFAKLVYDIMTTIIGALIGGIKTSAQMAIMSGQIKDMEIKKQGMKPGEIKKYTVATTKEERDSGMGATKTITLEDRLASQYAKMNQMAEKRDAEFKTLIENTIVKIQSNSDMGTEIGEKFNNVFNTPELREMLYNVRLIANASDNAILRGDI